MTNTNTNTVSWADLAGFDNISADSLATSFNDSVGGSFFGLGKHTDVTIDSIEPRLSKAGNKYLWVTFTNDEGAQISKAVLLKGRDGNVHFAYSQLASAVVNDKLLRIEAFSDAFVKNPELLDSLRGLKVSIKITQGDEGYLIEKEPITGNYLLVDVETGKSYDDTKDDVFESYSDAKDKAEELSITRCYNNISSVSRGTKDAYETNESVLRKVLDSAGAGTIKLAQTMSSASRPAV